MPADEVAALLLASGVEVAHRLTAVLAELQVDFQVSRRVFRAGPAVWRYMLAAGARDWADGGKPSALLVRGAGTARRAFALRPRHP